MIYIYLIIAFFVIGVFLIAIYNHEPYERPYHTAKYDRTTQVMTVTYIDNTKEQYKGSGTVWRKLPYMNLCHARDQVWLTQIYNYIKEWGGVYPISHKYGKKK